MIKSWGKLYPGDSYRWQPGDAVQVEAWTGLTLLIREHQSPYRDKERRAWIEERLRAWAKKECDTERRSGSEPG